MTDRFWLLPTLALTGLIATSVATLNQSEAATNTTTKSLAVSDSICSELPFAGVAFPPQLTGNEQVEYQLALNLSGSFEGNYGWDNISTDFDGMGLSLGLLNQNLGAGTLQPMLIQMQMQHPAEFQSLFTPAQYKSISRMLTNYENLAAPGPATVDGRKKLLSPQDDWGETQPTNSRVAAPVPEQQALTAAQESVDWARSNLYSNSRSSEFNPDWLNSLQALASNTNYVTIQVSTAESIHEQAQSLMDSLSMTELRSYLLMFDFVVQNGGIYDTDITNYLSLLRRNPNWDETKKLTTIIQLRLSHVNRRWWAGTQARKMAIVNGYGRVNEVSRNFQQEYCYQGQAKYN